MFILFVLIPVKSSLADWNWVPTGSMKPTIVEGDMVYVNKLAYGLRFPLTLKRISQWGDPERGDIVVLFSPEDDTRLVKRVVGLPGDEISMKNNKLSINGEFVAYEPLDPSKVQDVEPLLRQYSIFENENLDGRKHAVMSTPAIAAARRDFDGFTVPEGHYFVMGDNRDNSKDSRYFGFVERKLIIGEATHVICSFNKLDKYQPRYNRFFTDLE